jgi:hypothetical protein
MRISSLALVIAAPVLASFVDQTPLTYDTSANDEYYKFKRPIRKVAIIGAGVGYVRVLASCLPPARG